MWKNGNQPRGYLAGAIEGAPDSGRQWRDMMEQFMRSELQHEVFNPCREESHILTPVEFRNFRAWKTEDLARFRQVMHKIITTDISMILEKVDYLVCLWDKYVMTGGGTQGELTVAFWRGIPVYMVTDLPRNEISSWIIGCTTEIFPDFPALKNFLITHYRKRD